MKSEKTHDAVIAEKFFIENLYHTFSVWLQKSDPEFQSHRVVKLQEPIVVWMIEQCTA